jgi:hypothetical protein
MVVLRLGVLLLLATTGGLLAAEPKAAAVRAYERGARELEFGRFGEAAAAFVEAIALDPRESPQPVARPSGMNFAPYLPHLALGIARCEAGDPAGAVASWAESDRQAAARAARGAARLLQRREECTERHSESLRAAEGARSVGTSPGIAAEPATPTPGESPPPEEPTPVVIPSAAVEAKSNAPATTQAPRAASDSPPELLLRAAQELFDGWPARAYAMLEGFASDRPRSNGQAHLLRSAAGFELARLEPASAARWLTRARRARLAALRAAPGLAPDRRYFAPAFVEFFATGAAPAALPDLLEP